MTKPKIYLCDLIHNYFYSEESYYVVPLNIGFIGAYLKGFLGDAVQIKLFKYPDRLIKALKTNMPDIIGFSYYTWNEELVRHIAKKIKEINSSVLVVLGGPNIDVAAPCLTRFFQDHPYFDYYIPFEGEELFARLVKAYMEIGDVSEIKKTAIKGAATYLDGLNYSAGDRARPAKYINYPSPYLTGIMDEFIKDPYLFPLFETSRGCPFSCTYCTWGDSVRNYMRMWPLERVFDDFEYVVKHGANQERWIFADSNFGMHERDIEIAERIYSISKKRSGVKSILAWNSKNTTQRNIKIAEILGKLNGFLIAFQTLDKGVLLNIKRQNIAESSFAGLIDYFKSKAADIETDILIGLPGETFESHLSTLRKCFDYDIRYIRGMNIRLLKGSEMASEESRNKFGIKTKYRLIKDSYGYYWDGWAIDCEEIVRSTNAMSESEMLKLRLVHFFIWLFWNNGFLQPLMVIGKSCGINPIDQILSLIDAKDAVSPEFSRIISDYMMEASDEWHETKEGLINYHLQSKNIAKKLEKFNFLNFKYTSKIIFTNGVFSEIANFLEAHLIFNKPSKTKDCDPERVKEFALKRLCLNLSQIDESKSLRLTKNAYEFLVKEKFITKTASFEKNVGFGDYRIELRLKNKKFIINELKRCKEKNKSYEKIVTAKFLQNLIYSA